LSVDADHDTDTLDPDTDAATPDGTDGATVSGVGSDPAVKVRARVGR
jgi:hypothetical protein